MTTDMTQGKPLRLIVAFAWPLLLGNVIQMAYSLADMMIVGQCLGKEALAAVGGVGSTLFVVIGFVFGITAGAGVITAQRFGAQDAEGVRRSVGTGAWTCGLIALATTLLCTLGTPLILRLLQTPAEVFPTAQTYLTILFIGTPLPVFFNFQSATLRALGDSRTPLYFLAGASILNIALDFLFIRGFGWGVAGAAWATNTAIFTSGLTCLFAVTLRHEALHLSPRDWIPRWAMAWEQLRIAVPMGLQFSVTGLGAMVLQSAINSFGVVLMAGMTAARNVENVACQLPIALGQAMATYSAQNYGAGKLRRVREGVNACVRLTFISGAAFTALTYLMAGPFIRAFLEAGAEESIAIGKQMLHICAPFFIPLGLIFIFRNTLQGIGRSFLPMLAGVVEMILRMSVALLLIPFWGKFAVYWGDPLAWVGAAVLLLAAYGHFLWQQRTRRAR